MPASFNLTGEIADITSASLVTGAANNIAVPTGMGAVVVKSTAASGSKMWARQSASSGSAPANAGVVATPADMTNSVAFHTLDLTRLLLPNLALYTDTAQTVELYWYRGRKAPDSGDTTTWSRTVLPTVLQTAS